MGVAISGKIIYQGGQITRGFSGIVTPNKGFKVDAPQSIDGAKFTSVAEVQAEWLK
ncbi:hypothetical protein SGX31_004013 [Escherichia coli]|nr:hypothetical protein [Escherichia coli]